GSSRAISVFLGAEAALRGLCEAAAYEQEIRREPRVSGRALELCFLLRKKRDDESEVDLRWRAFAGARATLGGGLAGRNPRDSQLKERTSMNTPLTATMIIT